MSLSSAFMEWLMPDWVKCNSRAAWVKLPVCASTQKARTCRLSRGGLIYESGSSFPLKLRKAIIAPEALGGTRVANGRSGSEPLPHCDEKDPTRSSHPAATNAPSGLRAAHRLRAIGDGGRARPVSQIRTRGHSQP